VGAGADVDLSASTVKHDIPWHVCDGGNHVEAFVESHDQAGTDGHTDLLADVEHPIL
jgi:hypothetical protein